MVEAARKILPEKWAGCAGGRNDHGVLGNSFVDVYDKFPDEPKHYSGETVSAALAEICRAAVAHASSRIEWYARNAKRKARPAKMLRLTSLILFAFGTIAPISVAFLLQPTDRFGTKAAARAEWNLFDYFGILPMAETGYVLLACAGALIIFDQFFDSSGSWIRFRQSEARLQVLLAEFRFAWAGAMAKTAGSLDAAQTAAFVGMARDFVTKVEILAEEETSAWAQRFSERLNSFDRNPNLQVSLSGEQQSSRGPVNGSVNGAGRSNGRATPPPEQGDDQNASAGASGGS